MAKREWEMIAGANGYEVYGTAALKVKELNEAHKDSETAVRKADEQYQNLWKTLGGLTKGIEGISKAYKDTLYKATKSLDVDFSELADEYVARMDMVAIDVAKKMGVSRQPQTKAAEEAIRTEIRLTEGLEKGDSKNHPYSLDIGSSDKRFLTEKENFINELLALDETYSNEQKRIDKETWDSKIRSAGYSSGAIANTLQNLYSVTGKNNRAMFEAMKGFAIAETVIQTYRAAQGAYAALSWIPGVGPALGIAAAAAAVAAGIARVNLISETQPDGATGTISAEGTANPSYSGGSFDAYPVPTATEESKSTQYVTVQIYNPLSEQNWQKIVEDNIIPALKEAGDRNISVTVKNMGSL